MEGVQPPYNNMKMKISLIRRPSWFPKETMEQKHRYIAMMDPCGVDVPRFEYYNIMDETFRQEGREYDYRSTQRLGIQRLYHIVIGEAGFKCGLVASILDQPRKIAFWFQKQRYFRSGDSSVLPTNNEYSSVDHISNHEGDQKMKSTELKLKSMQKTRQSFDPLEKVRMLVPDTPDSVDTNFHCLEYLISTINELSKMRIQIYERFIYLEYIMKGFKLPCNMDVKIGLIRRQSRFSEETVEQRLRYLAMMKSLGFGIPEFEYYDVLDKTYRQEEKEYGYRLSQRQKIQTLYDFVKGKTGFKCGLVASILDQLQKIADWFRRQRHFQSEDSSVLPTYSAKILIEYSSVNHLSNHGGDRKTKSTELKQKSMRNACRSLEPLEKVLMLVPDTPDNANVRTNCYWLEYLISTSKN